MQKIKTDVLLLGVLVAVILVGFFHVRVRSAYFLDRSGVPVAQSSGEDYLAIYNWTSDLRVSLDEYLKPRNPPNNYPPMHAILHLPLTLFSFHTSYLIFVWLSFAAFLAGLGLSLQGLLKDLDLRPLWGLVVLTLGGLLSQTYPVLFSFERGNNEILNGFLILICISALQNRSPWLGLIALTLGAQLKVYPAVFCLVFLLYRYYRHFLYFVIINAVCLLVLGLRGFQNFLEGIFSKMDYARLAWEGNHSIFSFFSVLNQAGFLAGSDPMKIHTLLALLLFLVLTAMVILESLRKSGQESSFSKNLIYGMIFMFTGLGFPISNDYKLPIMIIPFLLVVADQSILVESGKGRKTLLVILAVLTGLLFLPPHYHWPRSPVLFLLFLDYFALWLLEFRKAAQSRV